MQDGEPYAHESSHCAEAAQLSGAGRERVSSAVRSAFMSQVRVISSHSQRPPWPVRNQKLLPQSNPYAVYLSLVCNRWLNCTPWYLHSFKRSLICNRGQRFTVIQLWPILNRCTLYTAMNHALTNSKSGYLPVKLKLKSSTLWRCIIKKK
jgi:hypothetical protein